MFAILFIREILFCIFSIVFRYRRTVLTTFNFQMETYNLNFKSQEIIFLKFVGTHYYTFFYNYISLITDRQDKKKNVTCYSAFHQSKLRI